MGKQYKNLSDKDIEFIKKQKVFYIASCSDKEVNLAPKGYDSLRVLGNDRILFLSYTGSGNRTHRDACNKGKFTLMFNSYEKRPMIVKVFCVAIIINKSSNKFKDYLQLFDEKESLVRDFFIFNIYAVERSCGTGIPVMDFKYERSILKDWMHKQEKDNRLIKYQIEHSEPPSLDNL